MREVICGWCGWRWGAKGGHAVLCDALRPGSAHAAECQLQQHMHGVAKAEQLNVPSNTIGHWDAWLQPLDCAACMKYMISHVKVPCVRTHKIGQAAPLRHVLDHTLGQHRSTRAGLIHRRVGTSSHDQF